MSPETYSIAMPVGAYHPLLPAALESLARQPVNLEVAFLDASGDPRVRDIADKYNRLFSYRRHGPDGGQSAAINEGWRNTNGAIIGWLNADDMLFPEALGAVDAVFAKDPEIDVVYGHSTIVNNSGAMIGYHWAVEPPGPRLLEAGIVSQPSCLFRRTACEAVGGVDEDLHYTMDWDLWIRMHLNGARFQFLEAPLSIVLWGEDTKTSSFNEKRRAELRRIINQHAPEKSRRRIFRSFAIHNLLERVRPAGLKKALERTLVRGRKRVCGLAADGALADRTTLWLTHFEEEPYRGLTLSVEHAGNIAAILIDGEEITWTAHDGRIAITFAEPVRRGAVMACVLEKRPGRSAYFTKSEWVR